jgi:two-component system, cell cycle sensor histidine kinase and response regulator CckA
LWWSDYIPALDKHLGTLSKSRQIGMGVALFSELEATNPNGLDIMDASHPISESSLAQTILLVEDEPVVREVTRAVLQRAGYLVLEANGPLAAIALSRTYEGRIDLLLTDVVMPGMNGPDLATELRAHQPHMAMLFMSGYADHEVLRRVLKAPTVPYIQKPFTLDCLLLNVSSALAGMSRNNAKIRCPRGLAN